jgi:hypothetical protein
MLIDVGKCRHLWTLSFDQALHIICKLLWAWLAIRQATSPLWFQ